MEFLHSGGYIHGNIKPENIFGKKSYEEHCAKLGDFSLLKIRSCVLYFILMLEKHENRFKTAKEFIDFMVKERMV